MKWRHWSILIILVLLNYLIFSTAFTQLAEQRQPGPRPTRTPWPTFENIEPSPVAWVVLPTSTPVPTRTPITPTPTMDTTASADNTSTIEATATVPENPPETVTRSTTATPTRTPKPPTATPSGQTIIHKVKRGQTLSEIAKDYGVTV
ncbi:MAG: LysM domain-containing protein, partial [Anaerolineae bacterium]